MKQVILILAFIAVVGIAAYVAIELTSRDSVEPPPVDEPAEVSTPTPTSPPPQIRPVPETEPDQLPQPGQKAALKVRITDATGSAVAGASVWFLFQGKRIAKISDPSGEVTTDFAAPVSLIVLASAPGCARGGIPEFRVEEATRLSLNISLEKEAPISGSVREGLTGRPLPRAVIRAESQLEPEEGEKAWLEAGIPLAATTGSDGAYRISAPPGGLYTIIAEDDQHLPGKRKGIRPGTTDVDFALRKGGVIYGTVERAGSWERVPGARVILRRIDREKTTAAAFTTNASGEFVIRKLPEGEYILHADLGEERSHLLAEDGEPVSLSITKNIAGVHLFLHRWEKGSISGTVTDLGGEPIEGAEVLLRREEMDEEPQRTVTSFSGKYQFRGIDEGTYLLSAQAKRNIGPPETVALGSGENRTDLDLILAPGFFVRGKVLAGEAMEPVADGAVSVEGDLSRPAETAVDGFYELGPLAPGTYLIRASASGRALALTGLRQVHVVDRDVEGVELVLATGGGLRGEVRSATGPVKAARVYLAFPSQGGGEMEAEGTSTLTNDRGEFELGGVRPGSTVTVAARAPGYRIGMSPELTVSGSQWVNVPTIRMEPSGAWVEGTVTSLSGDPADGIPVIVESNTYKREFRYAGREGSDWWKWEAKSSSTGEFRIGPLPEGEYQAGIPIDPPLRPPIQRFQLGETGTQRLRFTLGQLQKVRNGFIRGRVTREDGTPVPGIRISAWSRTYGELGSTESDESGEYSLDGVVQRAKLVVKAEATGAPGHRGLATMCRETVAPAEKVDFVLPRTGGITGKVTGVEGQPAGSFRVTLERLEALPGPPLPQPAAEIDPRTGGFAFRGLAPGNYNVTATAPNRSRKETAPVEVKAGETTAGIQIALGEGSTLGGRVVADSDGKPVPGARILIQESMGLLSSPEAAAVTVTDQRGEFVIRHLSPGKIYLVADHGLFARSEPAAVEIPEEGLPQPVEIRLFVGGSIFGSVVDSSGRPMPGERVTIRGRSAHTAVPLTTVTDGDGGFRYPHLPEGRYDVRWGSISKQVQVGKEGESKVVFRAAE